MNSWKHKKQIISDICNVLEVTASQSFDKFPKNIA